MTWKLSLAVQIKTIHPGYHSTRIDIYNNKTSAVFFLQNEFESIYIVDSVQEWRYIFPKSKLKKKTYINCNRFVILLLSSIIKPPSAVQFNIYVDLCGLSRLLALILITKKRVDAWGERYIRLHFYLSIIAIDIAIEILKKPQLLSNQGL